MFTGIIKHLGVVRRQSPNHLTISCKTSIPGLTKAESIAVNGVCLTITKIDRMGVFTVDIMPETLEKTTLASLKMQSLVNLELPVTTKTFFSGHIVAGHVDGVAKLEGVLKKGNSINLKFSVPEKLSKYIVNKGSIAINGISLTVIAAGKKYFTAGIVPYTWDNTMLNTLKTGDRVNIETDILAKYLERLLRK